MNHNFVYSDTTTEPIIIDAAPMPQPMAAGAASSEPSWTRPGYLDLLLGSAPTTVPTNYLMPVEPATNATSPTSSGTAEPWALVEQTANSFQDGMKATKKYASKTTTTTTTWFNNHGGLRYHKPEGEPEQIPPEAAPKSE